MVIFLRFLNLGFLSILATKLNDGYDFRARYIYIYYCYGERHIYTK
jgi:hypothetical protein